MDPISIILILFFVCIIFGSFLDIDLDSNNAVDIAYGGTNASTTEQARINLGLEIGSDVLAPDGSGASLTGIPHDADFSGSDGFLARISDSYALVENIDIDLTEDYVFVGNGSDKAEGTAPATALATMTSARGDVAATDYTSSTTWTGIDDGAGGDPTAEIWYTIKNNRVFVDFHIDGVKDGAGVYVSFTLPAACTLDSDRTAYLRNLSVDKSEGGTYLAEPAMILMIPGQATVRIYRSGKGSAETDWPDNTDITLDGQFNFEAD